MYAASRESLTVLNQRLDVATGGDNIAVAQAAQTGSELFGIVEVLDSDRGLRVVVADTSATTEQCSGLVQSLSTGKISETTLNLVADAAAQVWSTPREMREGLVELSRRALLHSVEGRGQSETVESELFQLGHIPTEQSQLEQLLTDKAATSEAKHGPLASVLYGKATSVTETLALQAVDRSSKCPADDTNSLSRLATGPWNHVVARMTSTTVALDEQERVLADKLGRVYSKVMSIHTVIDKSTLGGLVVRVDDGVINGSLSTKLGELRIGLG